MLPTFRPKNNIIKKKQDLSFSSSSTKNGADEIICFEEDDDEDDANTTATAEMNKFIENNFGNKNVDATIKIITNNPLKPTQMHNVMEKITELQNNNLQTKEQAKFIPIQNEIKEPKLLQRPPKNPTNEIVYDSVLDKYVITDEGETSVIMFADIVKSILNMEVVDVKIKKYFGIITLNSQINQKEWVFMDSVFTRNLDAMVKIQNYIYDLIQSNEFENNTELYKQNLIIFYGEMINFMYKSNYGITDDQKLNKVFASLSFRLSYVITKQQTNLKKELEKMEQELKKISEIKNKLEQKVNKDNVLNTNTDINTSIEYVGEEGETETQPSIKGGSIQNSLSSVSSTSDSLSSDEDKSYNSNSASDNAYSA